MTNQMFCFQCEQTASCKGCTGAAGVCGKKADTAELQDKLTGALIGLSHAIGENMELVTKNTDKLVTEGLFATITNVNFNNQTIQELIDKVRSEKERFAAKSLNPVVAEARTMICVPFGKGTRIFVL